MKRRLLYTRRAERDIRDLDPAVRERVGKTLLRYSEEPLRHAERLTTTGIGSFRFRIGDYRVIFDMEGGDIIVLRVGHRREIYRR